MEVSGSTWTNFDQSLKRNTYRPDRVKRTYIEKPDGRQRPLGIPTMRDRIVQTAALLVLEAIFEADFLDTSFGFRPGRLRTSTLCKRYATT